MSEIYEPGNHIIVVMLSDESANPKFLNKAGLIIDSSFDGTEHNILFADGHTETYLSGEIELLRKDYIV